MDLQKNQRPTARIKTGTAIRTAAEVVDTKPVNTRLQAFLTAHTAYVEAQRKLEEAEALLRSEQVRLAAIEPGFVDGLARALIADGQALANPFAAFGAPSPAAIRSLPLFEKPQAFRDLAASVQRRTTPSPGVLAAVQMVEQLANQLDPTTGTIGSLRSEVAKARQVRDVLGQSWETTLAALRRGARAAADEGAPGLYSALFAQPRRVKKGKTAVAEPPSTAPVAPAAPTATEQAVAVAA